MRISIIHYSCPPFVGGVEKVIEAHAAKFHELGCRVKLIVGQGKQFRRGVPAKIIPEMRTMHLADPEAHREILRGRPGENFLRLREKLRARLSRELASTDICIIHNVLTMHFNLALTAALAEIIREEDRVKFISWIHDTSFNDDNYSTAMKEGYPWEILRTGMKKVRHVAISKHRRGKTAALYGIKPSSISVIPDGIDIGEFLNLSANTLYLFNRLKLFAAGFVFLYPARIVRRKNIEFALRIVREFNAAGKDARLLLTSQPDPHNKEGMAYFRSLKKKAMELGIRDKVIFISGVKDASGKPMAVDEHMLRDLYLLSDCLLFTSSAEGFGIPMLEAGLCRLPIACASIAPLREIGGGDVFYLDPAEPASRTASRLRRRLQESPQSKMFRRVLSGYSWEAVFRDRIMPLVEEVYSSSS